MHRNLVEVGDMWFLMCAESQTDMFVTTLQSLLSHQKQNNK